MPEIPVDRNNEPPLPILYRDEQIVVIDKPPGLLVHRSEIDRHETRFAIQILRDQIGQHVWPAHRLDRGTSGVLLFGLSKEIASQLGRQFEAGTVGKKYLAVVRGYPPESGSIDHALSRQRDPYEFQGERSSTEPQSALTHFRTLAKIELPVEVDRYPAVVTPLSSWNRLPVGATRSGVTSNTSPTRSSAMPPMAKDGTTATLPNI